MTMEPVFAALFAVLLGGESATSQMLLGGALVLAAMLIVELVPRRKGAPDADYASGSRQRLSKQECYLFTSRL